MPSYTTFKGVGFVGETTVSEKIMENLQCWLDWSMLEIGAYQNINVDDEDAWGNNLSTLYYRSEPNYTDGQVWGGFRQNWVWESGTAQSVQPIEYSGCWVDGDFHPITGGDHYVDYTNGRIVFSSAISTTSTVKAGYSLKWANFIDAEALPWFSQVQYDSFRGDVFGINLGGSGDYNNETKVELPAVALQFGAGRYDPIALGGGQTAINEIVFYIFGETQSDVRKITDIISQQNEKTIWLYNPDLLADSGVYPLDYRGMLQNGAKTYPQLTELYEDGGFRYNKMTFLDSATTRTKQITNRLHMSTVRISTEVDLPGI